jgi:16S rRNA G966 N2-methylase RsmD
MGLAERATVLSLTVEQALPTLRGPFTLVFADPPYRDVATAAWTMTALQTSPATAEGGLLALEHATRVDPSMGAPAEWVQLRQRAYGDTSVSIYRMERRRE